MGFEAQSRSISSLLSWTKRLISVRKSSPAFGRGTITFIRPLNRSILAYVRQYGDEVILCVANLSRAAQATELDLAPWKDRIPLEMLGRTTFPAIGELPYMITLAPYGFYWFRLTEKPAETRSPAVVPEFETLVVPLGAVWESLGRTRGVFERDVLPQHLALARWFPEHAQAAITAKLLGAVPCAPDEIMSRPWFVFCEATHRGQTSRYAMPLRINWSRFDRARYNPNALAAVRQGAREGTLADVAADKEFISMLLDNVRSGFSIEDQGFRLEFHGTKRFIDTPMQSIDSVRAVQTEQSNSTALVDHHYVVKTYRKLESGVNPEIEMGQFLTETAGFANTPALLGSVEVVEGDSRSALAIVHEFVENQGDAWSYTGNFLDRFIEEQRLLRSADNPPPSDERSQYQLILEQIGKRVAEMQIALASRDDIADFAPQPATHDEIWAWADAIMLRAQRAFEGLRRQREKATEADQELIDQVLGFAANFDEQVRRLLPRDGENISTRHHGDLHLGQMLIVKDDIFIIDFEGEPRRSLVERRRKAPAARDVAGLIRSIDYAATSALDRALKVEADDGFAAKTLTQWRDRATATFLAAYRAAMTDTRLWPSETTSSKRLLDFFLLEKVFYEIEYELAHRPDWLRVPLAGALRVLSQQQEIMT